MAEGNREQGGSQTSGKAGLGRCLGPGPFYGRAGGEEIIWYQTFGQTMDRRMVRRRK